MVNSRQILGKRAEDAAASYLLAHGYGLLARNWRTRSGELDIVAQEGEWLVFVEVRARSSATLGRPEESITAHKQSQLIRMADEYLSAQPWAGPWRIDILALLCRPDGTVLHLDHFRDAVGG